MDSALTLPPAEQLAALCRHWRIRQLRLFGSVARGEARPDSDIDLMVDYEPDADWSLTTKQAISIRLDRDVLAHFRATGAGWQARINTTLRRSIANRNGR